MSLRYEQYRSLVKTRDFLRSLLGGPAERPRTVAQLKAGALACLRHFPFLDERGQPHFSSDGFGPDILLSGENNSCEIVDTCGHS